MTESNWQSSYEFQSFLKSQGCEITPQSDPEYVDVYYKKSEKVVSIKTTGSLPPHQIQLVIQTLQIK